MTSMFHASEQMVRSLLGLHLDARHSIWEVPPMLPVGLGAYA